MCIRDRLTTNFLRVDIIDGLHNTEKIIIPNESPISVGEVAVSGSVQSFFISGSPDTDLKEVFTSWSFSGNELPSGSYLTSSIVEDAYLFLNKLLGVITIRGVLLFLIACLLKR